MSVYLDHNATTPVAPRVHMAMEPWSTRHFGNASSRDHAWGWDAAEAVEASRVTVAEAAGVPARAVLFTSGATEGLNTVVRGYVGYEGWRGKKIVTCVTEHDAVLAPSRRLCERTGVALEVLPVDGAGRIDLDALRAALAGTAGALVVLMAANNETGTLHPVRAIADIVHAAGGTFLCDTAQGFGKRPVDVPAEGIDIAAMSAHKCYGPKAVGALLVLERGEELLDPLLLGGGQERGFRGGTVNVPGAVGLGEACRFVTECLDDEMPRVRVLRDSFETAVLAEVPDTWINGDRAHRLCNTTNIGLKGVDARTLIRDMHDIAVSTRSACSSGHAGPSHVLKAIGLSDEDAYSCIRFSLGRFTTREEVDYAVGKVVASVHKLRRLKSART